MAGVIPKKLSERKKWPIPPPIDGQRGSLKRLRSQMASDGCPASQVVLAKQLLEGECEFKPDQKENDRLGVYWLLKASEQGHLEATDLLKTCLKTGRGISEHNYIDVKSCISMTQDEKIVRKAAKEVFASLSNGGDFITSNQLQKKILAIDRIDSCLSKSTDHDDLQYSSDGDFNTDLINHFDASSESEDDEIDWSQRSDSHNEKLTEDSLVSAAVSFSHGLLPTVNNALCLSEPDVRALDHIPFVYRSILHPILTVKILYLKLIQYLGRKSIPLPLAKSDVQLLALFLIYSAVSFKNLASFLPTVLFYFSFVIMVVSTLQLLQTQRELHDFRLWRGLFICYSNGDLNEYSFELQFILNHTKQYAWFFFALLLHYFMYSITPLKLESEFTVLSCCLMFVTLFGFMPRRRSKTIIDSLALLSFAVNVLTRYPYDTDPIVSKGWRYLELKFPSFPSYIVGNGIEFCISFRMVLSALIPLILIQMARKEKWRGSYKNVLPHLVTLSWLQYFALCSHNATTYGLFRATLALAGSVLFLPLVGLTSVIVPVAALTQWIVTSNIIYTVALFLFLVSICLAVCFMCAKTRYAHYTAAVQVVLMLVAFIALISSHGRSSSLVLNGFALEVESKPLEWDSFQRLCHQRVWENTENAALAQSRCAELENSQVFWEGIVSKVELVSISNWMKTFLDKFPKWITKYCYCFFGEMQGSCDQDDPSEISDCLILQQFSNNICSLKNYNSHSFEVSIKMPSLFWRLSPEVHLLLPDEFKNFTFALKSEDLVWFKGTLINNLQQGSKGILGSLSTYIKVSEIGCMSCKVRDLTSVKVEEGKLLSFQFDRIVQKFKFVLNVVFNPVLVFK
ncbi:wolframin isoform X1 [Euwallacea fornicatus]|uniref:wolframin isoform X1 n=2 Tax=Euwallacea fornicatus TaxID=995702 RepID=UPI00338EAEBD